MVQLISILVETVCAITFSENHFMQGKDIEFFVTISGDRTQTQARKSQFPDGTALKTPLSSPKPIMIHGRKT